MLSPTFTTAAVTWAAVINSATSRIGVSGPHTTGTPRSSDPTGCSGGSTPGSVATAAPPS